VGIIPPLRQAVGDKRHKYPLLAFGGLVNLLVAAVQVPTQAYFIAAVVG